MYLTNRQFRGKINMDDLEQLKQENEQLKQTLSDMAGEFLQADELKQENERLKATVKQLRQQLAGYKKYSRKQYDLERDHVPYHERED